MCTLRLLALKRTFPVIRQSNQNQRCGFLNRFGEQQSPGPLGRIFKNEFCQQVFFSRGKDPEFWVRGLNGSYKELAIQALNVLVQNPTICLAEKRFSVLVDITRKKRSCLLNDTVDDLMRTNERVYFSYRTSEIKQTPTLQKTDQKKLKEMQCKYIHCYVTYSLTKVTGKTAKGPYGSSSQAVTHSIFEG